MSELGSLLRQLRGKESLRDASRRVGTSHTYLNVLEKGFDPRTGKPIKPTPETLKIIARAYRYPYRDLLRISGYLSEADETDQVNEAIDEVKDDDALKPEQQLELEKVLGRADLAFRGKGLNESDRKRIIDMLAVLFRDAAGKEHV